MQLRYVGLGMYREWKKTEFPKEYYNLYEFGNNKIERWTKKWWQDEVREVGRIMKKVGREKYIT
jgi:hypothetical protein